ncbi:hypothetical protein VPH35_004169 [Triticum aestivum]
MAATPWLLFLCLTASGVFQARAQPDSKGFITIDCGLQGTGYVDNTTKLSVSADNGGFTDDAGTCHNISAEYVTPLMGKSWFNLRSFATGAGNCYTLRSIVPGLKYLVRARFMYGNYDGLHRLPMFDLHIGVNFWRTVNISSPFAAKFVEVIVVVPDDYVQVCMINTGAGMPFISGLDLRPLKKTMYPHVTAAQGLVLLARFNFGGDQNTGIRYPDDPHDRIWLPWVNSSSWTELSTTRKVKYEADSPFEAPTAVMQTAIRPRNASHNIEFDWEPQLQPNDPSPGYIIIMHFSELQLLPSNAVREFYINLNGNLLNRDAVRPPHLYGDASYNTFAIRKSYYIISINGTANSTLPPIINALELFSVVPTTKAPTLPQTPRTVLSAITAIKAKYQVGKNWMGDPCGPGTVMVWDSLTCSYAITDYKSVSSSYLDLSSRGLNGDISSSFANLKVVQYLNLSNKNLVGSIPDVLSQLTSLKVLDLSGNQLNGSIPSGLVVRVQDGSLDLRYGNNRDICTNGNSCQPPTKKAKEKSKLAIYIAIPTVLMVVIVVVVLFCFIRRKGQGSMNNSVRPRNEMMTSCASGDDLYGDSSLQLESRRFTYEELKMITNNFERVLGRGGFGYVYDGFLEDGTQVAVKLRSHSSSQGVKEFLAEARILTRIHHKNLVTMIGYCKDGEYLALVYGYMSEGTLHDHIEGQCLSWRQRLRIALESSQGIEYFHKGCNPPLVHRDVKATNILLNAKMEARIADFGLSKALTINMCPLPHSLATMQATAKSDVYSFGVVLLEIVTGKPAILREVAPISIIQWARQHMSQGNIESVVDARMSGIYDVNSVWKVVEIALKCTEYASTQRPTMTGVVVQLQECIDLEEGRTLEDANDDAYSSRGGDNLNLTYDGYFDNQSIDIDQNNTTFQPEHNVKRVLAMSTGPIAR